MQWLRLYDDVLDDPKVQQLSLKMFRYWIKILCLANKASTRGRIENDLNAIAYRLRCSTSEAKSVLHELQSVGLLDREGDQFVPHNWDTRQKKSDSSAERVARHRDKQEPRNVTKPLQKRNSNALDIEKRREEEKPPLPPEGNDEGKRKKNEYTQDFEALWLEYPPVVNNSKVKAYRAYRSLSKDDQRLARDSLPRMKGSDGWRRGFAPHASTYLNGRLWESEQPGANGRHPPVEKSEEQKQAEWLEYERILGRA